MRIFSYLVFCEKNKAVVDKINNAGYNINK